MFRKIILFSLLLCGLITNSQQLSPDAQVSIFTCDRGDQLYSTFGHTALRIKDPLNALDVVYNYGYFDFRTENFYFKFVKGDLQYFMKVTSYEDFVLEYQTEERKVIEQTLNFPPVKKQELFDALNKALLSEESYYTYKFIDRNCTTMIVDKINGLYGSKAIQKVDDKTISYRKLLYPYFEDFFWYKLGINIVFGAKTDKDAEKLFLPVELMHSLDKATFEGKPLVSKTETIVHGKEIKPSFSFLDSIYIVCIVLLIIVATNSKILFKVYLFVCGLLGLLLCLIGLYSLHEELLWNYNALLFNPLLVLIPFIRNDLLRKIGFTVLLMLLIYSIVTITKPHFVIMLPFIIANGYMLWRLNNGKLLSFVK